MREIRVNRRDLLRSFLIFSGFLTLAPFLPIGKFLSQEIKFERYRQKIANVNDLPPNSRLVFTYPITGDIEKDSDPFRKFVLIRLPDGRLRAYSMVCLHLWCLVDYKPERLQIECPCHGSIYDPYTGKGIRGPVANQPNKILPEVKLEVDENGDIYAVGVVGVVGYGREATK